MFPTLTFSQRELALSFFAKANKAIIIVFPQGNV